MTRVVGKAALSVSASMTPGAKLSSSVSGSLPKPWETLVATFVVRLESFWVKEMVELLSKAHSTEAFAHEIAQMRREEEMLKTYQPISLTYVRFLITYIAAL